MRATGVKGKKINFDVINYQRKDCFFVVDVALFDRQMQKWGERMRNIAKIEIVE